MSRLSRADLLKLPRGPELLGLKPVPVPRRGRVGKWEASFAAEVLEPMRLRGEIGNYRFEAITLTLYDGSANVKRARYSADWYVEATPRPWLIEVKGFRRQAGIVRLKSAAQQYASAFRFGIAEGGPGRWQEIVWLS